MAPESSARIFRDAATQAVSFIPVRRAWPGRGISRPGYRRGARATAPRGPDRPFFAGLEARGIRDSGIRRKILRLDVWLVSADRHRRKHRFLLRDFLACRLRAGPSRLEVAPCLTG